MEVFPTSIRQSGIGFATLISQTISIAGPYVIYLGQFDLKLPYLVMFIVCLVGAIGVSFIPETLGCSLPETLTEAAVFGKEDGYFSYMPQAKREKEKAENETFLASKDPEKSALERQEFVGKA